MSHVDAPETVPLLILRDRGIRPLRSDDLVGKKVALQLDPGCRTFIQTPYLVMVISSYSLIPRNVKTPFRHRAGATLAGKCFVLTGRTKSGGCARMKSV